MSDRGDIIDQANDRAAEEVARIEAAARAAAANMPAGEPGECELCGEWSGRLIDGHCAPCRDRHHLP